MADGREAISTQNAGIGYSGDLVVEGLNLSIPQARFTALIGPNGSGKSTILRSLAGLQRLQRGCVLLDGRAIAEQPTKAVARKIGFLSQGAIAPEGMTVLDLVRQGRYPHRGLFGGWSDADTIAVDDALRLTATGHLRDRRLDTLSGGQRQRAWIAMALAQQGEILLLDEPTTYLDLSHQIELLDLTRRLMETRGTTIVAVLHDLNQAARYADHVVMLRNGKVQAEGAPADVVTVDAVRSVFAVEVRVIEDPESGTPLCIPLKPKPSSEPPKTYGKFAT